MKTLQRLTLAALAAASLATTLSACARRASAALWLPKAITRAMPAFSAAMAPRVPPRYC